MRSVSCRWVGWVVAVFAPLFTAAASDAATVRYFLVAERPGAEEIGDSFVLPLSTWSHIFDARSQIRHPYRKDVPRIVSASIARGFDGVNRNLVSDSDHPWKWHITGVEGFFDYSAEIFDSSPTWVHFNIVRYMRETGGHIGFWNYQVVSELPAYQPLRLARPGPPLYVSAPAATAAPSPAALPMGLALMAAALRRRR